MKMNGTSLLKCLAALCMLGDVTASPSSSSVIIDFNSDASSCGGGGFMPDSYKVTLTPLRSSKRRASLDSENKHVLISILDTWVQKYSRLEATSNGTTRRKLETSTHVVYYLVLTQFAVVIKAGNDVRHAQHACTRPCRVSFAAHLYSPTDPHACARHQTIALMAKDPAVSSIERDCLQRAGMSLPESDSSSPGESHEMDQVLEAVTRRLSKYVGVSWAIDRIDGVIDNTYNDGNLTGKGVRVYIVDTGVQGSHVDFGGRVVNGHTVRARQSPPATPPPTSYNTT